MRLGHIVECEDAVSEFEEKVCAEGDEGPEGKNRDNFIRDQLWQRNELEIEREIERSDQKSD